ncbi:MAG: hypothetical protein RRY13_03865 [Akkermansia sp.]
MNQFSPGITAQKSNTGLEEKLMPTLRFAPLTQHVHHQTPVRHKEKNKRLGMLDSEAFVKMVRDTGIEPVKTICKRLIEELQ